VLPAQCTLSILGATSHRYDYGAADNLTSLQTPAGTTTATNSRSKKLTTINGQTVRSSPGGNIIDDAECGYTWDADNRLVSIAYKSQPGKSTRFDYNGLGRRLLAVETGSDGAIAETVFRWCGNQLCQSSKTSQSTG
jgi:YD repeat-containing protein